MRVLVACEFSGIVRDAFAARGHDAWSCDLLPSESSCQTHIQDDALFVANTNGPWDLMIAHPPCTYLTNSAVRWLYHGGRQENGRDEERWAAMYDAAEFYVRLRNAPVDRKCIENPRTMIGHARRYIDGDAKPRIQTIHGWQFGHGEKRATGLELINLPDLVPTNVVSGRKPRVHHASPGPDRWKERSRTLQGIADAMAYQWGGTP